MEEIDTRNRFLVGGQGDDVVIMLPVSGRIRRADALNLAAWIVAIADPLDDAFSKILEAVRKT
jgi:hypothetical protein